MAYWLTSTQTKSERIYFIISIIQWSEEWEVPINIWQRSTTRITDCHVNVTYTKAKYLYTQKGGDLAYNTFVCWPRHRL